MNQWVKIGLTLFIWITTLGAFIASLAIISSDMQGILVPITIFLFGASIMMNGFIWQWGQAESKDAAQVAQKQKRNEKIRDLIQVLSDDELLSLRDELDDMQVQGVGEDGELIYQERRR